MYWYIYIKTTQYFARVGTSFLGNIRNGLLTRNIIYFLTSQYYILGFFLQGKTLALLTIKKRQGVQWSVIKLSEIFFFTRQNLTIAIKSHCKKLLIV